MGLGNFDSTTMTGLEKAPGHNERYRTATGATNLRVEADRGGSADVIIAAGMNKCGLGILLIRLCGEWDSSEKVIFAVADQKRSNGTQQAQAASWHLHEQKILLAKLRTLPALIDIFCHWATTQSDIKNSAHIGEVLLWWLDHVCKECHGLRFRRIAGTPSLSNKSCPHCHGTGENKIPTDIENPRYLRGSKKMLGHISACVSDALASQNQRMLVRK